MMRISAVVPAYNAARTIAATLDSLLSQSLAPYEIVVIDDGSKDATREALEPYRDRVRLVFQANGGVSAARNRAVAEATGDWLAFCDADDLWHPDKLRVIAAVVASRPELDLVFHEFWTIINDRVADARATHSEHTMFPLFREFDISMPRILTEHRRVDVGGGEFPAVDTWYGHGFRWLMLGNFLMPSTVAVRREAFLRAGGFDAEFRYAEDTEFFLRFLKSRPFAWIDAPLTGYRREAGTLLTGNMLPTIRNATRAVVKHCIDDPQVLQADPDYVRSAVSRRFLRLAYYCLSELQLPEARIYARTALKYQPTAARAWMIAAASLLPAGVLRAGRRVKSGLAAR